MKRNLMENGLLHLLSQRRVWAALLAGLSVALTVLGHAEYAATVTAFAGALGLHSYMYPKED